MCLKRRVFPHTADHDAEISRSQLEIAPPSKHSLPQLIGHIRIDSDHAVAEFATPADVPSFFASHPESTFVFTTDEAYDDLSSTLPDDVVILDSRPRFLHAGRILLLSRLLPAATDQKLTEPSTTK